VDRVQSTHFFLGTNHWHAFGVLAFPILIFQCNLFFLPLCGDELLALFHRFIFRSQVTTWKCRRCHGLQPASAGARFMNRTLGKRLRFASSN